MCGVAPCPITPNLLLSSPSYSSFYLTAPFWAFYFVIGAVLAFIYDAFKPADKHRARMWGYVADSCTMVTIIISIALVCDNKQTLGQYPEPKMFRPAAADQFTDAASAYRLWDNLSGRIMAPLTSLWIYALSTGRGYTAMLLRHPFLVSTLSPLSYNCFLFHQVSNLALCPASERMNHPR